MSRRRRLVLQAAVGFLALNAWYGAVGLVTGWMSIGDELEARLPLGSPVLAGIALAVVVAVPASALVVMAGRAPEAEVRFTAFVVGAVVVAWILVELAFIREVSYLHPVVLGYGAALMIWGRRGSAPSDRGSADPVRRASATKVST